MSQFDDKQQLTVYSHSEHCQLHHNELCVLSYLLFQARYDDVVSYKKTAAKTGFDEKTVSRIVERLRAQGFIDAEGKAVMPSDKWYWFREKRPTGEHPSQRLHFRITWVLNSGKQNPLTPAAISIYSYLRMKAEEGFEPPNGWSKAYLAMVLKLDIGTVGENLTTLANLKMIKYVSQPFEAAPYSNLTSEQLSYFADKVVFKENSVRGKVYLIENGIAPEPEIIYNDAVEKMVTFVEPILRKELGEDHEKRIATAIKSLRAKQISYQEKDWASYARHLAGQIRALASTTHRPDCDIV